jgi:SAM-dependent methyltransferase
MTRHLDLGCGAKPRNPYGCDNLFGVDIAPGRSSEGVTLCTGNVALDPIPFADNHFDAVSAYDFFEHVPRVLPRPEGRTLRFPFVELMDEVWRVLRPGGRLYAQTPCAPHAAAFQDPTHVNFITRQTHLYFTQPRLMAAMYGFRGDFSVLRVQPVRPDQDYEPMSAGLVQRLRSWHRERRGANSHLIWEFSANKPTSA